MFLNFPITVEQTIYAYLSTARCIEFNRPEGFYICLKRFEDERSVTKFFNFDVDVVSDSKINPKNRDASVL